MLINDGQMLSKERKKRKVVEVNVHATIPKGNMGYDRYTVPDTVAVEPTFVLLSFSTRKHMSIASRAILSNFVEEQRTQNDPQYLSGLLRALFPTTILEIAVDCIHTGTFIRRYDTIRYFIKRGVYA